MKPEEWEYLEKIQNLFKVTPDKAKSFPQLVIESRNLKDLLLKAPKTKLDQALLQELIKEKTYALFERIFNLSMCLSPSTCECEIGFGLAEFPQNKWRNRLKAGRLNSLMHNKLNKASFQEVNISLAMRFGTAKSLKKISSH